MDLEQKSDPGAWCSIVLSHGVNKNNNKGGSVKISDYF
jgi:hypothetical protein